MELQPEAPTRTTGCRKFVENEMLGANLGFVVSKVGKFEEFLTGLASFKAKYQVNGRGYRPSSMRYFTFYRFRTKVENLPDHVDSFPTGGGMAPTLIWRHPCFNDDQTPHLFDFPWSLPRAQIFRYKQKLFGAILSL